MEKQEVIEALEGLLNDIALITVERHDDEIRSWLMAATLRIWAGNKLFAEDYARILPVFKNQEYTTAQIITALDCAGDEMREMDVPVFFRSVVSKDKENNTSESRTMADSIGRFLVLPALFNGDFTMEEAHALRGISDLLIGYCDDYDVTAGKEREYHPEMVTPLNKTGYYQPSFDVKEKTAETLDKNEAVNLPPNDAASASKTENGAPTITLNLNITPEKTDVTDENAPASGVTVKKPSDKRNADEEETFESVLTELEGLVGLDKVKNDVRSLLNFIKVCQMRTQRGMKVPTVSYHLVFTGNPGTGKTTVARIVARLYYLMGILPQGQLVETDRDRKSVV